MEHIHYVRALDVAVLGEPGRHLRAGYTIGEESVRVDYEGMRAKESGVESAGGHGRRTVGKRRNQESGTWGKRIGGHRKAGRAVA